MIFTEYCCTKKASNNYYMAIYLFIMIKQTLFTHTQILQREDQTDVRNINVYTKEYSILNIYTTNNINAILCHH